MIDIFFGHFLVDFYARIHGAIMGQSSRQKNATLPIEEGKDCSSKAALADNNGEFFKVDMER